MFGDKLKAARMANPSSAPCVHKALFKRLFLLSIYDLVGIWWD